MVQVSVKNENTKSPCCVGMWHLFAGLIMIILGFFLWFNPMVSLIAVSLYIGAALMIIGAGYIASSFSVSSGWFMFVGVLDILIGVILVTNLGVTVATLPIIFALWCLAVGSAQLVSAYKFGIDDLPWGWSFALGILGLVFGFLMLRYPQFGALTISTLMGLYIVLYGLFEVGEYTYFKKLRHA